MFYSAPGIDDTQGVDYDVEGRIKVADIIGLGAGPDASYLLCGPARFLGEISAGLEAGGIHPDRIDFEMFGPVG